MDFREQLQRTLGDSYTLERELGGGGMSRVFVAQETGLGRPVVVKVLLPELAAGVSVERFRREIQLAAKLQHACIVPLLSAGVSDGLPFYTMPFVEGESLRARLTRDHELPIHEVVRVLRDIAGALSYAHEHGVVHRDIKPDNVLLTKHHALVTDFGVAKAVSEATNPGTQFTSVGVALGTPAYMSPEQAAADPQVDHRADIYALGVVAYEMLAGQPLFAARSPQAMLAAHAAEAPVPIAQRRPAIPPALAELVMRCLEKRAAARPQSADQLLQSLDALATPVSGTAPHETSRAPGPRDSPALKHRPRRGMLIAFAIAVAALLAAGGWRLSHRSGVPAVASDAGVRTIAVLPFAERNTDGGEFLGDGMAETLIFALGKVPGLRVAAQTSAFTFKGKETDLKTIGDQLGVATVLTGSLQRAGNRLRVTVRLENVADRSVLWTEQYNREVKDVFALQDDIARAVVNRLRSSSRKITTATIVNAGTTNVDAYQAYLQGRYFWGQRGDGIRKGLPFFERAVALDPNYALAWTGLADSYSLLSFYDDLPAREAMPKARQAAERALALDPGLAAAHASIAYVHQTYDFDWTGAEREYQRAIALDSTYVVARYWYGSFLALLRGRNADGVAQSRAAVALDPLSVQAANLLALGLTYAGRFDEAIPESRRAIALAPIWINYRTLGMAYRSAGRLREAIAVLDTANQLSKRHPWTVAALAIALAQTGDTAKARPLYDELVAGVNGGRVQSLHAAVVASWLGRTDDALRWLARARDKHDGWLGLSRAWPWGPVTRRDPRFVAFWTQFGVTPAPGAEQKP